MLIKVSQNSMEENLIEKIQLSLFLIILCSIDYKHIIFATAALCYAAIVGKGDFESGLRVFLFLGLFDTVCGLILFVTYFRILVDI